MIYLALMDCSHRMNQVKIWLFAGHTLSSIAISYTLGWSYEHCLYHAFFSGCWWIHRILLNICQSCSVSMLSNQNQTGHVIMQLPLNNVGMILTVSYYNTSPHPRIDIKFSVMFVVLFCTSWAAFANQSVTCCFNIMEEIGRKLVQWWWFCIQ